MMSPKQTTVKTLTLPNNPGKSRGLLKIRGDKIKTTEDPVKFQICATLISRKCMCLGSNNPYLLIERSRNFAGDSKVENDLEEALKLELGDKYVRPEKRNL